MLKILPLTQLDHLPSLRLPLTQLDHLPSLRLPLTQLDHLPSLRLPLTQLDHLLKGCPALMLDQVLVVVVRRHVLNITRRSYLRTRT